MSLIRLNNILFEKSSVTFRKQQLYTSSSSGITGNLTIASRPSSRVRGDTKDFVPDANNSTVSDNVNDAIKDFFNGSISGYESVSQVDSFLFPLLDLFQDARSSRDTKKINVSSSFGIYGSEVKFKPNQKLCYPHKLNSNFSQIVNPPARAVGSLIGSDALSIFDPPGGSNRFLTAEALDAVFKANVHTGNGVLEPQGSVLDSAHRILRINYVDDIPPIPGHSTLARPGPANSGRNLKRQIMAKKQITNTLMPYYASKYNNCDFSYTNYNTLNFCHTDDYPSKACLVYSGAFFPIRNRTRTSFRDFTFSFWINPRYTTATPGGEYDTGTIMHISSSLAISLVSGSSTDENGYLDGYRIMLQLSQSAETLPSLVDISGVETKSGFGNANLSYPSDMIYLTPDNSLKKNHWHYVSVKWSPFQLNGSGSIRIDEAITYFPIPKASGAFGDANSMQNHEKTIIGNFFDGPPDQMVKFFSSNNSRLDSAPIDALPGDDDVPAFNVTKSHPLNAELHELRGFKKYVSNIREDTIKSLGVDNYKTDDINFHVPVTFSRFIAGNIHGQRLYSPFTLGKHKYSSLDTDIRKLKNISRPNFTGDVGGLSSELKYFGMSTPFNPYFSMGIGGKYLNLENFVKNFAAVDNLPSFPAGNGKEGSAYFPMQEKRLSSPRLFNLSASLLGPEDTFVNTMDFSYSQGSIKKRNLMILPNDNGLFMPDYFYLKREEDGQKKNSHRYKTRLRTTDYSIVSLRNIVSSSDINDTIDTDTIRKLQEYSNYSRRNFPISYLTQDNDSNDVSIFSISSLYYGEQIHPGTFEITDIGLTGSNNKVSLKFKDDLRGSLYRADAKTQHASWASVGNLFYNEGICFIKSPHPPCFGKTNHEIKFKGEQTAHVLTVNVPAQRDKLTVSHNPNYLPVSASAFEQDQDNEMVYITGVNIHDENLNVIMKANLAQPVIKRQTDEYMFKIKLDF